MQNFLVGPFLFDFRVRVAFLPAFDKIREYSGRFEKGDFQWND